MTRKQQSILEAIVFLIRKGELPTVREVGALVGLRSPATVLKHLRVLERAHFISLSGKSRGIRIADPELLQQVLEDAASAEAEPAPSRGEEGGAVPEEDGLDTRAAAERLAGGRILQAHLPAAARFAPKGFQRGAWNLVGPSQDRFRSRGISLVGAIAAGQPFESFADGFFSESIDPGPVAGAGTATSGTPQDANHQNLPIDPRVFAQSGELFALRIEGDSMIRAGILDGDYVIIRRQNTVEEGEIAAVLIDGEGTLKRWTTSSSAAGSTEGRKTVRLLPENERFDPIEIHEGHNRDVLVIGKYVGLVRGELQIV